MNQKELNKTSVMISDLKKPIGLHVFFQKQFNALRVNPTFAQRFIYLPG